MDPIRPIPPATPGFRGQGSPPVERLQAISRERDRPRRQPRERRREPPALGGSESEPPEPDDGLPHIDVRA